MKLPKSSPLDECGDAVVRHLEEHSALLWDAGSVKVSYVPLTAALTAALSVARRAGQLRGGLENIEAILQRECVGLEGVSRSAEQGERISRVLLMSNDGSERFYRHCGTLLERYQQRVIGLRLDVAGDVIGRRFFGKEATVKAVLVGRKEFVARVLASLISDGHPNPTR